jgi:hypothetical protein
VHLLVWGAWCLRMDLEGLMLILLMDWLDSIDIVSALWLFLDNYSVLWIFGYSSWAFWNTVSQLECRFVLLAEVVAIIISWLLLSLLTHSLLPTLKRSWFFHDTWCDVESSQLWWHCHIFGQFFLEIKVPQVLLLYSRLLTDLLGLEIDIRAILVSLKLAIAQVVTIVVVVGI